MPEPFSWLLGILKFLAKPVFDFFAARRKTARDRKVTLDRFYVELEDAKNHALESMKLLANEHNRRNDPAERAGRRWDRYGPISSASRLEFFAIKGIYERHYEDFSLDQRRAIPKVFLFADRYNSLLADLDALHGEMFSKYEWDFAAKPVVTLATFVFLTAMLVEQKERFKVAETETSTSIVQKVLDGWNIRMYGIELEDAE
ncbi:hypothetical protein [Pseudomonas sp. CH235]|uniref:hypothetical protein n=1 Tax=Pseudomonas sp. CH235 TaxID=1634006 RepID=UPI0010640BD2|nr:hypothetical protein [Pseudomonas sp. CH235]TEA58667.1 hypothetical protein EIY71_26720 [Pseudomonas sp. CH235]